MQGGVVAPAGSATKKIYLEMLRGIAIFFVVYNHTGYFGFLLFRDAGSPPIYGFYLFMATICKIAVPLFFMVSGGLLIPKDEDLKTVYRKRVLRMVLVIVVFSMAQYIFNLVVQGGGFSIGYYLKTMYHSPDFRGSYWFLYTFLALMVMLPWVRRLGRAMTNNEFWYLIAVEVVFVGIRPVGEYVLHLQSSYLDFPLLASPIFFFLIGYFIEHRLADRFYRRKYAYITVVASLAAIIVTGVMTWLTTRRIGQWNEGIAQAYLNNLIAIPTITVYFLVKYFCERVTIGPAARKIIIWFGGTAFGIYLIESMFRSRLLGILTRMQPHLTRFISVIVFVVIVLLLSAAVTTVLKKVPLLKKLL